MKNVKIASDLTISNVLNLMDERDCRLFIIVDNINKFKGLISIGDIQRAIIKKISLNKSINSILRKQFNIAKPDDSLDSIKEIMLKERIEFMPVVDSDNNIQKIIFWDELFEDKFIFESDKINLPVVIMAGGKGERLKPISNILPKPLFPIGSETMLEKIINTFSLYGCSEYFISLNYQSELIKYYIKNVLKISSKINYYVENEPLGTGGALYLMKNKIASTFIVTNCDILIQDDFNKIYKYHTENKNVITIVGAVENIFLPYGVLESNDDGILKSIEEKPEFSFIVNTGVYICEPNIFELIKKQKFIHITDIIKQAIKNNMKVRVFPISHKSWIDIGDWNKYIINNKL